MIPYVKIMANERYGRADRTILLQNIGKGYGRDHYKQK